MFPGNRKGFHDVFGNAWEWLECNFNGLPGFKTHYLYTDFSTPCFDGRHNLIAGGSWISTGDEASAFARFMFRRHFFQHCSFRMARSLPDDYSGSLPDPQVRLIADRIAILGHGIPDGDLAADLDPSQVRIKFYETENKQYLLDSHLQPHNFLNELQFEYEVARCQEYRPVWWFQKFMSLVKSCIELQAITPQTALHIGSSTGRISFELALSFEKVKFFLKCEIQGTLI